MEIGEGRKSKGRERVALTGVLERRRGRAISSTRTQILRTGLGMCMQSMNARASNIKDRVCYKREKINCVIVGDFHAADTCDVLDARHQRSIDSVTLEYQYHLSCGCTDCITLVESVSIRPSGSEFCA